MKPSVLAGTLLMNEKTLVVPSWILSLRLPWVHEYQLCRGLSGCWTKMANIHMEASNPFSFYPSSWNELKGIRMLFLWSLSGEGKNPRNHSILIQGLGNLMNIWMLPKSESATWQTTLLHLSSWAEQLTACLDIP